MKNQVKPIITALLLGTVFMANANTLPANPTIKPFAYSAYKIEGKAAIKLAINKLKGSKMEICLKDAKGQILFVVGMLKNETNLRSELNLEQLQKGTYTIELTDGKNIEIKKIEI